MEEKAPLFMSLFQRLKHEINNTPKNLSWLATERKDLQDLCYSLETNYIALKEYINKKDSKYIFVPNSFEAQFKEYELNYRGKVLKAAEPIKDRVAGDFRSLIQDLEQKWLDDGKTSYEFWTYLDKELGINPYLHSFDAIKDNPASIIEDLKQWCKDHIDTMSADLYLFVDEGHIVNDYNLFLGAINFFEETIGFDFNAIYERWGKTPILFISESLNTTNTTPIIDLYHEAVRSYIFGNRTASVVMCRALMEHILQKYYRVKGTNLQNIIVLAEMKFPQLRKLNMDNKRKLANNILHEYENKQSGLEDKAVIDFLITIKDLVQKIPVKN